VVPALLKQREGSPEKGVELGQVGELVGLSVAGPQCAGQRALEPCHSGLRCRGGLVNAHAAPRWPRRGFDTAGNTLMISVRYLAPFLQRKPLNVLGSITTARVHRAVLLGLIGSILGWADRKGNQ